NKSLPVYKDAVIAGLYFFFFFQAEDGIRDRTVTGVQTCALPIYAADIGVMRPRRDISDMPIFRENRRDDGDVGQVRAVGERVVRSEERRVGKECRSGWSADE